MFFLVTLTQSLWLSLGWVLLSWRFLFVNLEEDRDWSLRGEETFDLGNHWLMLCFLVRSLFFVLLRIAELLGDKLKAPW